MSAKKDPWKIIEEGWDPELNETSESLCSIGNGRFGQRANFEEGKKGSIVEGKNADLVMLNIDILKAPKEKVLKSYVELTIKNGVVVYEYHSYATKKYF